MFALFRHYPYYLHRCHHTGSVRRFYGRWCRRLFGRLILLSASDVCFPRNSRPAGGSNFDILPLRTQKASGALFRNRCNDRCRYYGSRLFSRQSLYLQHTGICHSQIALSDIAGRSRRYNRYDTLLEM